MNKYFLQKNKLFLLTFFLAIVSFNAPTLADPLDKIEEFTAMLNDKPDTAYAIALHESPKYPKDFKHVAFVNPDAPKGGTLRLHNTGTFDSLNPFIIKGVPAAGLNYLRSGLTYESLMQNAWDEPFTLYGVIAESITIPEDKHWARFKLRDEARWSDGEPITAHDVIWTFRTLVEKGQPFFKAYWNDVESVEAIDDKTVIFKFAVRGNAELPLIIAELPILPKHYWSDEEHNFEETTLEPPVSSGPYKIDKVIAGRSIEYARDPDWWGKDLPFFKGMNNFDRIIYDYYRDENVAHEAFLARDYDVKIENVAKIWYEGYSVSSEKSKHLIKEDIENTRPAGMQAFIYNIRRPVFQNDNVRDALAYALDFEWSNKQFAYGDYVRTNSYFDNSDLSSCCNLPDESELEILEPLRGKIPDEVFTDVYKAPVTDGSGNNRSNLQAGIKLLEEAGYTQLNEDSVRFKTLPDGSVQTLEFEILHYSSTFEKWVLPFVKNLKRMGVLANFRVVDTAQFQRRTNTYDFDVMISDFGQSSSPGNEQREFWGSDKADIEGSRNLIGIKDPVIDDLVTQVIHAKSRKDLVTKTRALDRILLWNHYVIPMWHYPEWRIAYWDKIKRPETLSGMSPLIVQTWWSAETETKAQEK
ncbi:MAG: ABC transporter substrate-binding protein [Alphaproteobacteria bacterium]|nr:ABC transporter substrate-binding protein [Alphaproteobacteria bacterium]